MTDTFETLKVNNDQQIQEVAELAEMIWHEHFTPIIGTSQVEYLSLIHISEPTRP